MTGYQLPTFPQPDPLPQPGPDWLFWALLLATFVTHLVAMNVLLGGTIIAAIARWRRPPGAGAARHREAMVSLVARLMPTAVAATVTLGVAPLLFVQVLYGRVFFSTSVLMAWWWLSVVALLIGAYGVSYALSFRARAGGGGGHALGWTVAALLVAIAFIYVNNMSLTWRPDRLAAMAAAGSAGGHLNLGDVTLAPRFLHMLLGALAVGGAGIAVMGLSARRRDETLARSMVRHGAWWFTFATGVNVLTGLWWIAALPRQTLSGFMGEGLAAPLVLLAGIVTGLVALVLMARCRRVEAPWTLVKTSAWLIAATIVLMAVTRDQLRQLALAAAGFGPRQWIVPQWGAIALFVVLLAIALGSVAWMVAALVRGGRTGTTTAGV